RVFSSSRSAARVSVRTAYVAGATRASNCRRDLRRRARSVVLTGVYVYFVLDDRPRRNARARAVPFHVRLAGTPRIFREKGTIESPSDEPGSPRRGRGTHRR